MEKYRAGSFRFAFLVNRSKKRNLTDYAFLYETKKLHADYLTSHFRTCFFIGSFLERHIETARGAIILAIIYDIFMKITTKSFDLCKRFHL